MGQAIQQTEIDVSTPPEADLQRFSEQQINDYCEKVLNLCLTARTDGSLMFESVQIIKQLQAQVRQWGIEWDEYHGLPTPLTTVAQQHGKGTIT